MRLRGLVVLLRIGILASTRATDMEAILEAIRNKRLNAEIVCLISNKKNAYALERARRNGIEAIFVDPKGKDPVEYDMEIALELERRKVDLVLLIGYNRLLSPQFVKKFRNRIMNIHPSLLPAFPGWDLNVHRAVLESGVKITGCTLHFVDEKMDAGPIILQKAVEVREDDDEESLKRRVQEAESEVLVEGIRLFQEGRIIVEQGKTRILREGETKPLSNHRD
ncbi:MAG: phosphoribosylglycinamide formyltransferase [Candidatus Brockarchaeota archaeon]|nr:phosphoribosylglycinamide formyltransferase [Candidatus Brockarchaeota archaeon]